MRIFRAISQAWTYMDSTIDCLDTVAFRTSSVYCAVSTVSMVCMDGIWMVKSVVGGCGLSSH